MNYAETLEYLNTQTPMFQNVGANAYNPGLHTIQVLDDSYDHPHDSYRTIHVAGTNGKGSTSHLLASILQEQGYKVGLYTSPHLIDFRERIRVNGEMISQDYVIEFVESYKKQKNNKFKDISPSFFELTTMMAFCYFRETKVDFAVIEVGLGGRCDSTNIIKPEVSIITNISFDHTQILGHTLAAIATEKAGIIKPHTPIVIGEAEGEVLETILHVSNTNSAPIFFAQEQQPLVVKTYDKHLVFESKAYGEIIGALNGYCQRYNAATVLTAIDILSKKYCISKDSITKGFANVIENTGLLGRWMKMSDTPLTICDTGHNVGGWQHITRQLSATAHDTLHMVIGFVNDKDVSTLLSMMPKDAVYYFTQASVTRALKAECLQQKASEYGLNGKAFDSVAAAYKAAREVTRTDDLIFIGGSTFIVADFLSDIK